MIDFLECSEGFIRYGSSCYKVLQDSKFNIGRSSCLNQGNK